MYVFFSFNVKMDVLRIVQCIGSTVGVLSREIDFEISAHLTILEHGILLTDAEDTGTPPVDEMKLWCVRGDIDSAIAMHMHCNAPFIQPYPLVHK